MQWAFRGEPIPHPTPAALQSVALDSGSSVSVPTPATPSTPAQADGPSPEAAPLSAEATTSVVPAVLTPAIVSKVADLLEELVQVFRPSVSAAVAASNRFDGGESRAGQKRQDRAVHPASWAGPAPVPGATQIAPREVTEPDGTPPLGQVFGRPGRPLSFQVAPQGPPFAAYIEDTRSLMNLAYLAQPAEVAKCLALDIKGVLRTDFRVLVDGGANVSMITADTAERLGLPVSPTSMRVATSSDGGAHPPSAGTVGPLRFVYGAGTILQLEVWHHLFVVPDAGPRQIF